MGVEPADDWRRGVVVDPPPPASPPKFELAPDAVSSTPLWPVQEILDGAFFVIGTALVMWLGWIVVTVGIDGWLGISSSFLFWVLLAYVGLPRLQEVLSKIYVPDYFIGRSLTDVGVLGDPVNLALDGTRRTSMPPCAEPDGSVRMSPPSARRGGSSSRRCFGVPTPRLRSPRWSSSDSGRPSPTSRRWTATPLNATTCVSGRSPMAGSYLGGSGSVGWPPRRTTGQWASPCSPSRCRTAWTPTSTSSATTSSTRSATPTRSLPARHQGLLHAFTTRNGGGDVVRTDGSLPILDLTRLQAQEPDQVEPATDVLSRAVSHRIPPPSLLAATVMSLAKAVTTLTAVLVAILQGDSPAARASTVEPTVMGGGALCLIGLWAFLLAHHAWARIALMVASTAEAVTQLIDLSTVDDIKLPRADKRSDHGPHPHRRELGRGPALGDNRSTRLSSIRARPHQVVEPGDGDLEEPQRVHVVADPGPSSGQVSVDPSDPLSEASPSITCLSWQPPDHSSNRRSQPRSLAAEVWSPSVVAVDADGPFFSGSARHQSKRW